MKCSDSDNPDCANHRPLTSVDEGRAFSMRVKVLRAAWGITFGMVCLIGLLNVLLRDRWSFWRPINYATPLGVLSVASWLLVWFGRLWSVRAKWHRVAMLFAIGLSVGWYVRDVRIVATAKIPPRALRVLFWNVGRGWFADWNRIAVELRRFDADVLALAEVTADEVQTREFWRDRLPGFEPLPLHGGLLLLVKGGARKQAAGRLASGGRFRRASVRVQEQSFDMLLADVISDPLHSRKPTLDELFAIMQSQRDVPTLVVGDFNTPPDSVCFDAWRADWSRAWEVAGLGFQPTWPQPLPVLTLDHVWGNRGVQFHSCRHEWTTCSDHRPVVSEITIAGLSQEGNPKAAGKPESAVDMRGDSQ